MTVGTFISIVFNLIRNILRKKEAQKQREEAYRPRLAVYFEKKHRNSLRLLVKNVGGSPAYQLKATCEAPWLKRMFKPHCWEGLNSSSTSDDFCWTPFYTEIRPGQEISLWRLNHTKYTETGTDDTNYDNFFDRSGIERLLMREQPLRVALEYEDDKKRLYKDPPFFANPSEVFQFDPEDTKIFSPLFVPTEADYEEMMQLIDDAVALHLGSTSRYVLTRKDSSGKIILFEDTIELKGYARDFSNIIPDILDGQYKNCFGTPDDDLYRRFIEAVKEIWMQILRILSFKPIEDYLVGVQTWNFLDKHFPDPNSEERKKELQELDKEGEIILNKCNKDDLNANDILNLRYFSTFYKTFFKCNSDTILQLAKNFPKNIKEAPNFSDRRSITVSGSDPHKVKETMKFALSKMEEITEKTYIDGCEVSPGRYREDYHSIANILEKTQKRLSKKDDIYSKQLLIFVRELQSIFNNYRLRYDNAAFQTLQEAELSYIATKEAFKHEPDARKRQMLKRKFQSTLFKFARLLSGNEKYPSCEESTNIKKEFDEILEDFKKDTTATQPTSDA